jgi:hypothetical protein
MSGLAGVLLRQDFVEAVETLKKISGMVQLPPPRPLDPISLSHPSSLSVHSQDKHFPISLHELTACIYYKLAIERGVRGCFPDEEFYQHLTPQSLQTVLNQLPTTASALATAMPPLPRKNDWKPEHDEEDFNIVCEDLSNRDLDVIIKFVPSSSSSLSIELIYCSLPLGILPLL